MKLNFTKPRRFSKVYVKSPFIMREYHAPFEPNFFYHIFNHAIGDENLFIEHKNYFFFLEKWDKYLSKYLEVWTYCLMPNHFHFLVKVKTSNSFPKKENINKLLESQFKKLFSSYALSFNKVYNRKGSLFQKRFKRVVLDSEKYLYTLIHYIHLNPIYHQFTNSYDEWPYSSYKAILSDKPTKISRKAVLKYFDGKKNFIDNHNQMKDYKKIEHLVVE